MYMDIRLFGDAHDQPPLVLVLLNICEFVIVIRRPVTKTSHHRFMFLKRLHSNAVLDIDREYIAVEVPDKELSLPIVEHHRREFEAAQPSINALQRSIFRRPYLEAVRMQGDKAVESLVEDDFQAHLLVRQ